MDNLELYVAFCHRRASGDPVHWLFVACPPGLDRCTWYHATGGREEGYILDISANKRLNSQGIERLEYIGSVPAKESRKITSAAQRVRLQRCQGWLVGLRGELERKGLIAPGTHDLYHDKVEPSRYEASGSGSSSSRRSRYGHGSSGRSSGSRITSSSSYAPQGTTAAVHEISCPPSSAVAYQEVADPHSGRAHAPQDYADYYYGYEEGSGYYYSYY